ncbi:MAG: zinc-dependent alcohol dehydrogenase family protein [Acidimicrobiales bacterium]
MQAVVIDKPGDVSLADLPDPVPGPEDIVVAVRACGICGTDLHIIDGDFALATYPLVPGHEFAGEVVAVGREAKGISAGMMVTADPNNYCGRCRPCREGHGNLCENFNAIGVTMPGAFADFVLVPYWLAHPLPAGFDMSVAALSEPLSCVVHGYDLVPSKLGDSFLIYGGGSIGLMLALLASRVGAISVTVVEPNPRRREIAKSFNIGEVVATDADLGTARFDVVIEASGSLAAIEDAGRRVGRGGVYHQFGVAPSEARATFSPFRLYNDEATFVGSMAVLHSFDRACDIAVHLDLGLSRLVTDLLPLSSYEEALALVRNGNGLKVQLVPGLSTALQTQQASP